MLRNSVLFVSVLAVFLSVNGCRQGDGEESILKGIDVQTSTINGDTYIGLDAIVKIGELKLPKLEIPIHQPETNADIGTLTLESLQDGTNRVAININYSAVQHSDPKLGSLLPNGRELPGAVQVGQNTLIGISILENSRIYVGGDLTKEIILGAAIGIPALDSSVNQLPIPLNIFMGLPFSADVYGVGGMYTSTEKGKSGVAIFAKKTLTLTPKPSQITSNRSLASPTHTEVEQLDQLTKFKLGQLLNSHRTLKVK